MDAQVLREYAKVGAQARLRELDTERQQILKVFPGIEKNGAQPTPAVSLKGAPRVPKRMSAARRKAISRRMKQWWAARQTAK